MKNWKQAKEAYLKDHLERAFVQPERRVSALTSIENTFKEKFIEPLKDEKVFSNVSKVYLMKIYECLKGNELSGAEKSVFNGLYKFAR